MRDFSPIMYNSQSFLADFHKGEKFGHQVMMY